MFKRFSVLKKSALAVAIAGFGLAAMPANASAAIIDFTVQEGVVNQANTNTPELVVDQLTGKYDELISFTPTSAGVGTVSGNFAGSIIVNWTSYTNNSSLVSSQIAADTGEVVGSENLYSMYATVTVSGTFTYVDCGIASCGFGLTGQNFFFEPTTAAAVVAVDEDRDTTKAFTTAGVAPTLGNTSDDQIIMNATKIYEPSSDGFLKIGGSGAFNLKFTDPTLTTFGKTYWPSLSLLTIITAITNGDVDSEALSLTNGGGTAQGDVSISFDNTTPVPEPATLTLFGLGLVGVARYRRKAQK